MTSQFPISNKTLMNNNPSTSPMHFYNPTKQPMISSALLYQQSQLGNSINSATNLGSFKPTKNFNFKPPNLNEIKNGTSSSTFLKSSTENGVGSNKFFLGNNSQPTMNKTLAGSINPSSSYIESSSQNKSLNSQMIKSSIQDSNIRQSKDQYYQPKNFKSFQTPTRRTPRMSEPMSQSLQVKQQTSKQTHFTNSQGSSFSSSLKQKQKQGGAFSKFKPFQPILQEKQSFLSKSNELSISSKGIQTRTFSFQPKKQLFLRQSNSSQSGKKLSMNNFEKIKELGAGKYGKVFLARQRLSGFICAVKMIEKQLLKQQQIVEQFIRELKIQMYLHHPHIIKMYGYFDDETNIYIILEVGTGGQLYHQLRKGDPMPQQKVAGFMKQICDAVNEIHSLRIIHRDIKPENIVLHENIIKLCDFGWSVHQDNKMRTTFCGTPLYVCPEILRGKEYDEKIDIWSLGIMMYQMLIGQNPFNITKEEELIKIVKDQIEIPSYIFVSLEARDFLDKCLQKNPTQRVNIRQLLNHDFFKKFPDKHEKKIAF